MRSRLPLLSLVVAIAVAALAAHAAGKPAPPVPAAKIASGTSLVVDSETDPSFALINARVDIGKLRQVGDALEAELAWPLRYGVLNDARAARPGVTIPEGSTSVSRERVICRPAGALSYEVEARIVSPDGKVLDRRSVDAAASRRKAEVQDEAMTKLSPLGAGYGPDPRSLVCWAAARKCEGRDFTWPPPPNRTPLEYSSRADAMRKAYAATFVPSCTLPS